MALSLDDIKRMSFVQKALAVGIILALMGAAYYSLYYQSAMAEEDMLRQNLGNLSQQLTQKQLVLEQKQKYEKEIAALNQDLQTALSKLPEQKEIPGLLISVSEASGQKGVDVQSFEPMAPVQKEFYAELPVKISVNGGYHETVLFFERVARLPRIVNIEDISIKNGKDQGASKSQPLLNTSCLIKTYVFVEKPSEEESQKVDQKAKKNEQKKK
jgi:type IV pilus assembly protein PilO